MLTLYRIFESDSHNYQRLVSLILVLTLGLGACSNGSSPPRSGSGPAIYSGQNPPAPPEKREESEGEARAATNAASAETERARADGENRDPIASLPLAPEVRELLEAERELARAPVELPREAENSATAPTATINVPTTNPAGNGSTAATPISTTRHTHAEHQGEHTDDHDHDEFHWELIGLGAVGAIYTSGLAWEAWHRYGPNAAAGHEGHGHAEGSSHDDHEGRPSPEEFAEMERELRESLEELFRAASQYGETVQPEETERSFRFGRDENTTAVARAPLTNLLLSSARALEASTRSVLACAHGHCGPHSHGPSVPVARSITNAGISGANGSTPDNAAQTTAPNLAGNRLQHGHAHSGPSRFIAEVIPEVNAALAEPATPELAPLYRRAGSWMARVGSAPWRMFFRDAPAATLNFFENPRMRSQAVAGWGSELIAERGVIPGSLLAAGLPPWTIIFETFFDPFHVWCQLGAPIYFAAANTVLFHGSAISNGLRYRSDELSLLERFRQSQRIRKLYRDVDRRRKRIIWSALSKGLAEGLSRNSHLGANNERFEDMRPWVRRFGQGPFWADLAETDRLAAPAAASSAEPTRFFAASASTAPSEPRSRLFARELDSIFSVDSNWNQNTRSMHWRELVAGVDELRSWLSSWTDLQFESSQVQGRRFLRIKWQLGQVGALLHQIELLGLAQIADVELMSPEANAHSRLANYAYLLEQSFATLQKLDGALRGQATELDAISRQIRGLKTDLQRAYRMPRGQNSSDVAGEDGLRDAREKLANLRCSGILEGKPFVVHPEL